MPQPLRSVGTVVIPATTVLFAACKNFVVGNDRVKISRIGLDFREWFLEKTEKPLAETTLCYANLVKQSADSQILRELGDKAKTTLAQIFALMERQPKGKKGVLLTNGLANIFYVCDVNAELRAVHVNCYDDGWYVDAYSVTDPDRWNDGDRVFSRNS